MCSAVEESLQGHAMTTLFLSQIELENFGKFQNASFEFHRKINVIDGDNGSGKTTILKAIEVLLWPVQSESTSDLRAAAGGYIVASKVKECPSVITGYFQELDNYQVNGIHHSLAASICGTSGKSAVKFRWDGDPKSIRQMREILANYGFHRTSVFFLSDEKIAMNKLKPMEFFRAELAENTLVKEVTKNVELVESRSQNLLDEAELYNVTSIACETAKKKIRNLLSADSENLELLMRQEELEEFVKYSEYKKLKDEACRLEEDIKKHGKRLESECKKNRTREARRVAVHAKNTSSSIHGDMAGEGSAGQMPEAIVERWKQELSREREDIAELRKRCGTSESLENEQNTLAAAIERDKLEFLRLDRKSIRSLLRKHSIEMRLKLLQTNGGTENNTEWSKRALEQKIEFLEEERAITEGDQRKLETTLSELRERLQEAMVHKDATEVQLNHEEKNLKILNDSEILEKFAIAELKELMTTGSQFETLEYDAMASLSTDFVQILQTMPSVLESIEVEDETEWPSSGYSGTFLDLIDVEPEFRALMYPLKAFLTTHLVRDIDLAWRLVAAIRKMEFSDGVRIISVNDYIAKEEISPQPDGTVRLSRYIELKPESPATSDEELRSRIQTVISSELRHYFVIDGDLATACERADRLWRNPEWELCRFVTRDGTCFSINERSNPPEGKNPINVYESLCEYWDSLRFQINNRKQDLKRLNEAQEKCRAEHSHLFDIVASKVNEIGKIRVELHVKLSLQKSLISKSSDLDSQIKELQEDLLLEQSHSGGRPLKDELSERLRASDVDRENVNQEKRRLNDSIVESTATLARLLVSNTKDDIDRRRVDDLQCHAALLESHIEDAEEFRERIDDVDLGDQDGFDYEGRSVEQVRGDELDPKESEATDLRMTIFLLRRKLESVEGKIAAAGHMEAPSNWNSERDYAKELEMLGERSTSAKGFDIDRTLRKKLSQSTKGAIQTYRVSNEAVETLKRVLDVSREKALLPDLGTDALASLVERFKKNFIALAPRGGVRLVSSAKTPTQGGDAVRKTKRRKVDAGSSQSTEARGDAAVEVSFNTTSSEFRIPSQLSGGEKSVLDLSVFLSRTALNPPRILVLDEVDAPFDYSAQSRFARFIETFESGCQIFLVSHKSLRGSLKADKRIFLQSDVEMQSRSQ